MQLEVDENSELGQPEVFNCVAPTPKVPGTFGK